MYNTLRAGILAPPIALALLACGAPPQSRTTTAPAVTAPESVIASTASNELSDEPTPAITVAPELLAQWGPIARLAGRYWILNDQGTAQYLEFNWQNEGRVLAFSGMDRDGNLLAGQFIIDSTTGQVAGLSVHRGEAYELMLDQHADAFVISSNVAGENIRTTYQPNGATSYRVTQEALRRSEWRLTRSQTLTVGSAQIVQTLGWPARTAEMEAAEAQAREELIERRPSFFSRLSSAFQDGTVAGVEEGTRDGVSTVTRQAITGDDESDNSLASSDEPLETGAEDTIE